MLNIKTDHMTEPLAEILYIENEIAASYEEPSWVENETARFSYIDRIQTFVQLIKTTFKAVLTQYDNATTIEDNLTIPDLRALDTNSSSCLSTIYTQVCRNR